MIKLKPLVNSCELVLKPVLPLPYKSCPICLKHVETSASSCAVCFYPFNNRQFFSTFDIEDYHRYSFIDSGKAHAYFAKNALLNPCSFCGSSYILSHETLHILDRSYPAHHELSNQFKDSIRCEVFYLSCSGCTFSSPYLYLYEFYIAYQFLIDAWFELNSRLPLIKYSELRLPEWSINNALLKKLKRYAADYLKNHTPQQSLFDVSRSDILGNMAEMYFMAGQERQGGHYV